MRRLGTIQALCAVAALAARVAPAAPSQTSAGPAPAFEIDHIWIVVSPGAPERAALERLGFGVAPATNRHEGQGTASVTFEFTNSYLELMWVDPDVPVAPGREVVVYKFRRKADWKSSGWSPFGLALHRTAAAPDSLPFATWPLSAPWMAPGESYAMITPRTDSLTPSFWVVPHPAPIVGESFVPRDAVDSIRASALRHPNRARRLTGVRLVLPASYQPTEAMRIFEGLGVVQVGHGDAWRLDLTLDGNRTHRTQDLRPTLPVVIRY